MGILYAATFVDKTVNRWTNEGGEFPDGATTTIAELINVSADSLEGLMKALASRYGYEGNHWSAGNSGEPGVQYLDFNMLEDNDGNPESESPTYIADYSFSIEKRIVSNVPDQEVGMLEGFAVDRY